MEKDQEQKNEILRSIWEDTRNIEKSMENLRKKLVLYLVNEEGGSYSKVARLLGFSRQLIMNYFRKSKKML